jgi:hypothetical protein
MTPVCILSTGDTSKSTSQESPETRAWGGPPVCWRRLQLKPYLWKTQTQSSSRSNAGMKCERTTRQAAAAFSRGTQHSISVYAAHLLVSGRYAAVRNRANMIKKIPGQRGRCSCDFLSKGTPAFFHIRTASAESHGSHLNYAVRNPLQQLQQNKRG